MEIKIPCLAIVVPCYNEQEVIETTIQKLSSVLNFLIEENKISSDSFLFFVDDGSKDNTSKILTKYNVLENNKVKYIKFTKNFGNQNAIIAGLKKVYENFDIDCIVTIDADLQQDETKIVEFINKMNEGYDVVAGVKKQRGEEPYYKKICAKLFYTTMNFLGVKIAKNHSEYRLLTKKALGLLMKYEENNTFLRGLIQELGLNSAYVDYDVKPREKGHSKFSFISLLKLGFMGLVSHSSRPLTMIFIIGIITTLLCFIVLTIAVILEFTTPKGLPNVHFFEVWNSFLAAIQILSIGIIGQYLGQILSEVKKRPKYLIEEERL